MKPTILAVDTAHGSCSAALWHHDAVAAFVHYTEPAKQAERLLPLIEEMLAKAGIGYDVITHLVASTGPGSFTGLRVGLSAISGIHIATGIPSYGLSSLEALAWRGLHHEKVTTPLIASAIDAYRGQVYLQMFKNAKQIPVPQGEPQLVSVKEMADLLSVKDCTLFGNIAEAPMVARSVTLALSPKHLPDATDIAEMAAKLLADKKELPPALPLYIRPPDAKPQARA